MLISCTCASTEGAMAEAQMCSEYWLISLILRYGLHGSAYWRPGCTSARVPLLGMSGESKLSHFNSLHHVMSPCCLELCKVLVVEGNRSKRGITQDGSGTYKGLKTLWMLYEGWILLRLDVSYINYVAHTPSTEMIPAADHFPERSWLFPEETVCIKHCRSAHLSSCKVCVINILIQTDGAFRAVFSIANTKRTATVQAVIMYVCMLVVIACGRTSFPRTYPPHVHNLSHHTSGHLHFPRKGCNHKVRGSESRCPLHTSKYNPSHSIVGES